MRVLVVGGGGREHALVWKLAHDSARPRIFCAPGNAGTAALATNLDLAATDLAGLLAERWFFFAQARHPQNIYYQAVS